MPKTQLAPQFDPAAIETAIYQRWMDAGVFTADVTSAKEPYVIVIPPPNVTDVLHMGHGLNNTVQDVLIRFERMRGREAEWLPGTDHAGIATQNVVERLLAKEGLSRHDLGREAFVERVWQHVHATGGIILDQLKAIGASCDWSRTRFTLDDRYSDAVKKVFVRLHRDGLVYRGYRVIHWCPRCQTALSDEEAEFHDRDGKLYHIRYRLTDSASGEYLTVATTRPETIFADVALVFHPDDDRYAHLRGKTALIPLNDIAIPIDVSPRVERDFGTGMLKVTPAHDANDFDIANELERELKRPVVIDQDAKMTQSEDGRRVPAELVGVDRFEAQRRTAALLEEAGLLERVEPYAHRVRQCYRCNTVVEPRLSDQWFVRMRELAQPALRAHREGKVSFVPKRWGKVYENWLEEIRDWNISRQLWWGHRIPAWHCQAEGCEEIMVAEEAPAACAKCGGPLRQDDDVLDTWFSSQLWPFATFGWPEQTEDLARFYPGHTLVTGPDIIFFWVARMVMIGYHIMGDRPFSTVYLNGIVRDNLHRKMSKSLGNGIDPLDVVGRFGADALRFTMIVNSPPGTDVLADPNDLDGTFSVGRNFANKIWNAGRFILSNLDAPIAAVGTEDLDTLELADRWILSRTQRAIDGTASLLADFRLSEAANELYHFFWDELADWYIEQVKPRLYGTEPGGDVARGVLLHVFQTTLALLHPFIPFITEELWGYLPGEGRSMLASSPWPAPEPAYRSEEVEARFGRVQSLVSAVRSIRAEYNVPPGAPVSASVEPSDAASRDAFDAERGTILRLAKIDTLSLDGPTSGVGAHAVLTDGSAVFVPLEGAIDVHAECARLRTEVDRMTKQLAAVAKKLANNQFVTRAPQDVVAREREKEQGWREQLDTLAAKLRSLGC
jgi:valyl-tRNA synthetase